MAQDTPSRKLDQYIVRFPDGMRDRLKAEAAQNNRSLNAEIVARLERTFMQSADLEDFSVKQEVKRHYAWMVMMMQVLAKSDDKAFDPIRELLQEMDQAGRKSASDWFFDNEMIK